MNIPNALTFLRIVLVIPILWLLSHGENIWAFAVFLFAGLTDVLDGWYARKFHCESALGKILDSTADKILVLSIWILLFYMGKIPAWGFLIFARDVGIFARMAIFSLQHKKLTTDMSKVNILGKVTTFFQILTICFLLLNIEASFFLLLTSALSIATGWSYFASKNHISSGV